MTKRLIVALAAVGLAAGLAGAGPASAIPTVPGFRCEHCPPGLGVKVLRAKVDVITPSGGLPTTQIHLGQSPTGKVVDVATPQMVHGRLYRVEFTGPLKKGTAYVITAKNSWGWGLTGFTYQGKPVRKRIHLTKFQA
ncbi:MAG: hypothetical protein QM728_11490 [Gordonia sp. (in: high G+C Gram-positive bacteria)]|uniref:hypothetical protein n=1 Tax=Gordonia sp. (in: high G+C Gram-positive bacteria) TaxID=84139 RepID=UPI0039E22EBA